MGFVRGQQPVEFDAATLATETVEIRLPDGYTVDELPPAVRAELGAAAVIQQ